MEDDAAKRLLVKLRAFISESLDEDERLLMGQLLAPGIARAYPEDQEVVGFSTTEWATGAVSESLIRALRDQGVRVVWGES